MKTGQNNKYDSKSCAGLNYISVFKIIFVWVGTGKSLSEALIFDQLTHNKTADCS